ncbi:hypothetical protein DRQ20_05860 [bacterium]|nr:MAG: hypothetical protein DRQ18_02795 [bacterium]RKZ25072.1 MAG: hypothetical protein DRQ20_05860 [bacterium]
MRLVVDSNVFVSALDPKDIFHSLCRRVFEKILENKLKVYSPSLVLVEVTCAIRRRTKRGISVVDPSRLRL